MSTAKIQKLLLLVSKSSEISTLRRTSATPVSSAHPSATSIPASPAPRHPRPDRPSIHKITDKKQGPPFDDPVTSFDNTVNEMVQR